MDTPSTQEDIPTWRAPDRGHFKANCDVGIPKGGGEGKLAVVIRDWKGNKVAHEIAALPKKNILPCNWFTFPPLSLFSILCNEEPL
ncbi:hypothetical protein RHMOL_Rhmol02G0083000 [Rhododendron molle]|uniref:Uncharacterized protein n=1 Tax=Rhododendron molle TaxID=49168 RepID=A0ACC0PP91_RHOML|nr:hypothetical protein RHMOL_Rhmol02G0083000 [Rhododendron molle]